MISRAKLQSCTFKAAILANQLSALHIINHHISQLLSVYKRWLGTFKTAENNWIDKFSAQNWTVIPILSAQITLKQRDLERGAEMFPLSAEMFHWNRFSSRLV